VSQPTQKNPEVAGLLQQAVEQIDRSLGSLAQRHPNIPPRLVEAMQYSLTAGGKRLRPALTIESARACGEGSPGPSTLAAAVAIELVHTFSLIHDDLPAMDDDDLRRGRPTNHKVFGEAMAILAGDALLALAFEIVATDADPALAPALVRELATAAGATGMIGGQVLDMQGEHQSLSLEQLQKIHAMKTGALLTAACRMGAIAAGAAPAAVEAITRYGEHLGIAFQIIDDVLDVTATPAQLGKATGKDADRGKNTYPRLIGLEASRQQAKSHLEDAITAIEPLGDQAEGLKAIAQFVVERER
jgi:geranylgeranyl diphosphate synthase type II